MDAETYLDWAMRQPEGQRYELVDGEVVAQASERARHARAKFAAARALEDAIRAAGKPCEVFPDGMAVRIDATTVYEPDASLRCGAPLDGDAVVFDDPVVIVEVLSPSTRGDDLGRKLVDYFRLESLGHYLMVDPERRTVVHHARGADGEVRMRVIREGGLRLDPPGIEIDTVAMFAGA
ncbi:MAG: Uma2 family endonuclease [Paracoccaceae bacterium]